MWETIINIFLVVLKFAFEQRESKKLNDKDFIDYITAYQRQKGGAGKSSTDFERALKDAQKEREEKRINPKT